MNILILTKYFPPEIGAASHLFYELSESLAARDHEVTVVTGFPTYNVDREELGEKYSSRFTLTETMNGIEVKRLREIPFPTQIPIMRGLDHLTIALVALFRGIFTDEADVILIYSPPLTLGLSACLLGKIKSAPYVVNVQDLFPQNAIDLGVVNNSVLIRVFEALERFVYRTSKALTVHSTGNREHLLEKGTAPEKVQVIHNWVDTEFIQPGEKSNKFREEHGLGDKFVVSFAGTMGYSQDMEIILKAAHRLEDKSDILFLFVGEGLKREDTESQAQELGLTNTLFLPLQPRERYPEVLNASDISLVTLTKEVETPVVPSKLLSIMASGRPVVASMNPNGDAPRLIDDAECGIYVSPGDVKGFTEAITDLYEDDSLREQMGTNGRQYAVDNLSRKVQVKKYERLFERVACRDRKEGGSG